MVWKIWLLLQEMSINQVDSSLMCFSGKAKYFGGIYMQDNIKSLVILTDHICLNLRGGWEEYKGNIVW